MMDEGLREQARESKRKISFACDAIMHEQCVRLYYIVGPTCRGSNDCVRAPLRYKREALAVHRDIQTDTSSRELPLSRGKAIQHTVDVGYYAPAARTTLNPAVFLVFLREIDLRLATPEYTPSGLGRVPSATRLWFATPRQIQYENSILLFTHFLHLFKTTKVYGKHQHI